MTVTQNWYYVAGLGILGWACLAVLAATRIPGRAQSWWAYACGAVGVLFCFGAGSYLANISEAQTLIKFLVDFKLVAFIVFVLVLTGLIKMLAGFVPDEFHPIALTSGMAAFAIALPMLVNFVPGTVGDNASQAVASVSATVVGQTQGWFG